MKTSSSDGSAISNRATRSPRSSTARRIVCGSTSRGTVSSTYSAPGRVTRTPGKASSQPSRSGPSARPSPSSAIRTTCRPEARLTSRTAPPTTTRPRSTMTSDSHSASTVSIWWVEKMSVLPRARISRKAARRIAVLTGSRPLNGSSMIRTVGSWTIEAMNWTFCWLPLLSSSVRRSAASAMRNRSSHSRTVRTASRRSTPYRPAKKTSCSSTVIRG